MNFPRLTSLVLLAFGAMSISNAVAQTGSVGIGTTSPDPSALLELNSTSKGVLIPRLTTDQIANMATPSDGLLVYRKDGTQPGLCYYRTGTGWVYVDPSGADNLGNHLVQQTLKLQDNPLQIRDDQFHQLRWNAGPDGPQLFGYNGGELGWNQGTYTPVLRWNSSNNVGIGITSPAYRLHVVHGIGTPVNPSNTNGLAIANSGNASSTTWVAYANSSDNNLAWYRNGVKEVEFVAGDGLNSVSDSTLKMGVSRLAPNQMAALMRLTPKTYHYKSTPNGPLQYGFMAQELAQVYPEMVRHGRDDDGKEYWTVNYLKLVPVLVQGMQEQQTQLEQQQAELRRCQQRLATLEAQVQALLARPVPAASK